VAEVSGDFALNLSAQTDDDLIVLAQGGDRDAFSLLYARHTSVLWLTARQMGVDEATAADLVQVAWMRLIERYDTVTGRGSVRPWLKQVIRNDARKFHTRGNRPIPTDDRTQSDLPPEEKAIEDDEHNRVRVAFSQLDSRCKKLLQMAVFPDPPLTYDELAVATGMARGSLGPTRQRCLQKLEALLGDVSQRVASDESTEQLTSATESSSQ
jgi:RNA polymerase sigma factor (sigma-70 family)